MRQRIDKLEYNQKEIIAMIKKMAKAFLKQKAAIRQLQRDNVSLKLRQKKVVEELHDAQEQLRLLRAGYK